MALRCLSVRKIVRLVILDRLAHCDNVREWTADSLGVTKYWLYQRLRDYGVPMGVPGRKGR